MIVPFAAGGPADLVARLLSAELAELIGQPCVVESLSGAGGATGTEAVLRAAADGHSLLLGSSSTLVLNPLLLVVVTATDGPMTLGALTERIRSEPGCLPFGSAGVGSISHLAGAPLAKEVGAEALHVLYRGPAPAVQAVLAREVAFFLDALSGVRQQVLGGALRALAVITPERSRFLPDVPAAPEAGMTQLEAFTWYGMLALRATPEDILEVIARRTGEAAARLAGAPREAGPLEFAKSIRAERSVWEPLIRSLSLLS